VCKDFQEKVTAKKWRLLNEVDFQEVKVQLVVFFYRKVVHILFIDL
jgi:hypothetical protein